MVVPAFRSWSFTKMRGSSPGLGQLVTPCLLNYQPRTASRSPIPLRTDIRHLESPISLCCCIYERLLGVSSSANDLPERALFGQPLPRHLQARSLPLFHLVQSCFMLETSEWYNCPDPTPSVRLDLSFLACTFIHLARFLNSHSFCFLAPVAPYSHSFAPKCFHPRSLPLQDLCPSAQLVMCSRMTTNPLHSLECLTFFP